MKWQERVCGDKAWKMADCFHQLINVNTTLASLQRDWQEGLRRLVEEELVDLEKCHSLAHESTTHHADVGHHDVYRVQGQGSTGLTGVRDQVTTKAGETSNQHEREYDQVLLQCLGLSTLNSVDLWHQLEDHSNVYRSVYHDQLARWMHVYPSTSFLIWSSESFEQTPHQHMEEMIEWLGLDPREVDPAVMNAKHHQRQYISSVPADVEARLMNFFRPHNERLFQLLVEHGFGEAVGELKSHFRV